MGIASIPPKSGGGIKSIQRGQALSAGNITITSVVTTKTFVRSFSQGAAGTVASASTSTGTLSPSGGNISGSGSTTTENNQSDINAAGSFSTYSGTYTFSGGTMNAITKSMGVFLLNATTLTATGACRYEVVEFA